jgi:hypothetical protein
MDSYWDNLNIENDPYEIVQKNKKLQEMKRWFEELPIYSSLSEDAIRAVSWEKVKELYVRIL